MTIIGLIIFSYILYLIIKLREDIYKVGIDDVEYIKIVIYGLLIFLDTLIICSLFLNQIGRI